MMTKLPKLKLAKLPKLPKTKLPKLPKTKLPKSTMSNKSGSAGRKGALGATSGY